MRKDHTLPRGELHRLWHKSAVLEGNSLGDPTERELIRLRRKSKLMMRLELATDLLEKRGVRGRRLLRSLEE